MNKHSRLYQELQQKIIDKQLARIALAVGLLAIGYFITRTIITFL